jgi:hypothetical protein
VFLVLFQQRLQVEWREQHLTAVALCWGTTGVVVVGQRKAGGARGDPYPGLLAVKTEQYGSANFGRVWRRM